SPPTDRGPDPGWITTSHIDGLAGWWKPPCLDLARSRGGKPPGLLYNGILPRGCHRSPRTRLRLRPLRARGEGGVPSTQRLPDAAACSKDWRGLVRVGWVAQGRAAEDAGVSRCEGLGTAFGKAGRQQSPTQVSIVERTDTLEVGRCALVCSCT